MVLIHTDEATAYLCPACTVSWIETLTTQGTQPKTLVEALHMDRCDHHKATCQGCIDALMEELSMRFGELAPVNKTAANRLLRVRNVLNKLYNRARNVAQEAA
jgi:hypothetical protein